MPKSYRADRQHVLLHFGAVNYQATVYVNGQQVADHKGGYDAFSADITEALHGDGAQELMVAVHAPIDSLDVPVGKQRRTAARDLLHGGLGHLADGLDGAGAGDAHRHAHRDARTSPAAPSRSAPRIAGELSPANALGRRLRRQHARRPCRGRRRTPPLTLKIDQPRLWSPADPFLYTFKATLRTAVR